jgi:hypothetical protein
VQWRQIPHWLVCAVKFNTSQGWQDTGRVIDLWILPFAHGHLYIARSLVHADNRVLCNTSQVGAAARGRYVTMVKFVEQLLLFWSMPPHCQAQFDERYPVLEQELGEAVGAVGAGGMG